ncbi:lasso RiPP family leader peptide-containing protein [Streptomyces sp. NPDC052101]
MSETLKSIESEDVYEPPLLAEAGEYAEVTQGLGGLMFVEGPAHYYE